MERFLYWISRILAVLFIAFLCLFSFDGFTEFTGWESVLGIIIHLAVPIVVLIGTLLAWKRDLVGTIIFLGFAIYYVGMVGLDRHWSWHLAISGPALLISILFFVHWILYRKEK